jgi:hypothetical protein
MMQLQFCANFIIAQAGCLRHEGCPNRDASRVRADGDSVLKSANPVLSIACQLLPCLFMNVLAWHSGPANLVFIAL